MTQLDWVQALSEDVSPMYVNQDTSKEAAKKIAPVSKAIRDKVYEEIVKNYGCTCDEIEQVLELSHQTASARIRELYKLSRLVDSGQRRQTRSGRKAIVWVAC